MSDPAEVAEAAPFGFGQRDAGEPDDVMRLAFCLDGDAAQLGVGKRPFLVTVLARAIALTRYTVSAELGLRGGTISAGIDWRRSRVTDRAFRACPAGIESNWTRVQFRNLTVQ